MFWSWGANKVYFKAGIVPGNRLYQSCNLPIFSKSNGTEGKTGQWWNVLNSTNYLNVKSLNLVALCEVLSYQGLATPPTKLQRIFIVSSILT